MSEPNLEVRAVSHSQTRVLSAVLELTKSPSLGTKLSEIEAKCDAGKGTEQLLNQLEYAGLIVSELRQTGTAGICDRFYKGAQNVRIDVVGPPEPEHSRR